MAKQRQTEERILLLLKNSWRLSQLLRRHDWIACEAFTPATTPMQRASPEPKCLRGNFILVRVPLRVYPCCTFCLLIFRVGFSRSAVRNAMTNTWTRRGTIRKECHDFMSRRTIDNNIRCGRARRERIVWLFFIMQNARIARCLEFPLSQAFRARPPRLIYEDLKWQIFNYKTPNNLLYFSRWYSVPRIPWERRIYRGNPTGFRL